MIDDPTSLIRDGMTIGIGGWGSRRKPMSLVRAVVRSRARDLTIVSFGGADVGILCATGQVTSVMHAFVSLDTVAIDPHFAAARQEGRVRNVELDEAMLVAGLRAASRRLPFEVTRSGLGSDAVEKNDAIRVITSPYDDGEKLIAMPAINLDLALIHLDRADASGAAVCLGPDLFFDDLFAGAATTTIASVESVVATSELLVDAPPTTSVLNPTHVDLVVERPGGAGFTAHPPHHERDEALQRAYVDSAASADNWHSFASRFVDVGEEQYARAVADFHSGGAR